MLMSNMACGRVAAARARRECHDEAAQKEANKLRAPTAEESRLAEKAAQEAEAAAPLRRNVTSCSSSCDATTARSAAPPSPIQRSAHQLSSSLNGSTPNQPSPSGIDEETKSIIHQMKAEKRLAEDGAHAGRPWRSRREAERFLETDLSSGWHGLSGSCY